MLEDELLEISNTVKNTAKANLSESLLLKEQDLYKRLIQYKMRYIDERSKMETFINGIENSKIRLIARLRFIEFKSWYDIADEITPFEKDLPDRTSPFKALKRYLDKDKSMSHMSH